jgi:hypothetical protein
MPQNLQKKVTTVLEVLRDLAFFVPRTGIRIDGSTQAFLLSLINAWRRKQRIIVEMHAPALTNSLRHPDTAPLNFLSEITNAMGLTDLGFDEVIWNEEVDEIVHLIKLAIDGGALTKVLAHPVDSALFRMRPRISMGFDLADDMPFSLARFPDIPEFTVAAGEKIETESVMHFEGFLRVVANADGEFIGLNKFMEIPNGKIPISRNRHRTVPTSSKVARTIVFAFASSEPHFKDWPTHHEKAARLTHGMFLQLVNKFFELDESVRYSNVQSFVTTAPPVMGRQ